MLLTVAAVLLALAGGGWWLQRVAFDRSASSEVITAIFEDTALRAEVSVLVAEAASGRLERTPEELAAFISEHFPAMTVDRSVRDSLAQIVGDAQAHMIGERAAPARITGQQMVQIVRDQHVFDLPAVVVPGDTVGWLSTARTVFAWLVPIAAIAALIVAVLGMIARPTTADAMFAVGVFCIGAAASVFLLGYAAAAYAIPLLVDEVWANVLPAIAAREAPVIAALALALGVLGFVLVFGVSGLEKRKTKGWSSPVRPARYSSEQRQWSR